ncbi:MAG: adenylate kinase [Candidatus Eremiobacteraeota bacterium]|nr:adenylate kinase [Candidatus Eremiobacteraeota bacterium]MBC5826661.1 adenylate kinase [Candidatus Eremiobacteraeota bacterium]
MRLILLGAPGAGKGTQARRLGEAFGLAQIGTGDMFRAAVAAESPMGLAAKEYLDNGELVPDEVTIGVVEERLHHDDARDGFVMDGFPRTSQQATAFDALLAKLKRRLSAVIELSVPRDELVRRLTRRWVCAHCNTSYNLLSAVPKVAGVCDRCGFLLVHRRDDDQEMVRHRLDVYDEKTAPLIAYYQGASLLRTVEGTKHIDEVFEDIAAAAGVPKEPTA